MKFKALALATCFLFSQKAYGNYAQGPFYLNDPYPRPLDYTNPNNYDITFNSQKQRQAFQFPSFPIPQGLLSNQLISSEPSRSQFFNQGSRFQKPSLSTKPSLSINRQDSPFQPNRQNPIAKLSKIKRSPDGSGNNQNYNLWGSTNSILKRKLKPVYSNNQSSLIKTRPQPREISNIVGNRDKNLQLSDKSLLFVIFGQFIDHDIDLIKEQQINAEEIKIPIPKCDPFFDKNCTGKQYINFKRSKFVKTNPREHPNQITSFIDCGNIYGSSQQTQNSLRSFINGQLKSDQDHLLPKNNKQQYLAGDIRVNQNGILTSVHTLFMNQHNRKSKEIAEKYPNLNDQEVYLASKNFVIGLFQKIIYDEWLPELLGTQYNTVIGEYKGYNPYINAEVSIQFATAGFRFGHALLVDDIHLRNEKNQVTQTYMLKDLFFRPDLVNKDSWKYFLNGAAQTSAKVKNGQIVDGIRNFLVTMPDKRDMKLDLFTLNVERGRDHGLPDYNSYRQAYGLKKIRNFNQIAPRNVASRLQQAYGCTDDVDLWVALASQTPVKGGAIGQLGARLIGQFFKNNRDGDRYWYQYAYPKQIVRQIKSTSFADVLRRNTGLKNIPRNPFRNSDDNDNDYNKCNQNCQNSNGFAFGDFGSRLFNNKYPNQNNFRTQRW